VGTGCLDFGIWTLRTVEEKLSRAESSAAIR